VRRDVDFLREKSIMMDRHPLPVEPDLAAPCHGIQFEEIADVLLKRRECKLATCPTRRGGHPLVRILVVVEEKFQRLVGEKPGIGFQMLFVEPLTFSPDTRQRLCHQRGNLIAFAFPAACWHTGDVVIVFDGTVVLASVEALNVGTALHVGV